MAKLRIGLDVGTTAVKAAAYSADGDMIAVADAASPVMQNPDGGREQDMNAVWKTVCGVLGDLAAQISDDEPVSLGVCAQGDGLWCVDKNGEPAYKAMLWNDTRTSGEVSQLVGSGATATIGRGCHTSLWSGTSATLWRWLREHHPDAAKATAHVFTCADWIGLKLTGKTATDFSNASIPFLDFNSRTYSGDHFSALGCDDLAQKLVPPSRADTTLGKIGSTAAAATGLREGMPVSVGTLDLSAMIVGMGMAKAGQTMMVLGTTAVINILTDHVDPVDNPVGASVLHPTSEGVIVRVFAPTTGAAALDWFMGLEGGKSDPAKTAALMDGMLKGIPPGANGVTFLPYLNGERAPFVAPDIRAAFHGLSATTGKSDMARAVMEGAAFSLRHCFEEEHGLPTAPVLLTGGGARNRIWCGIIADVIGQPVLVSTATDHGLWGAATLGGAAAGLGDAITLAHRHEEQTEYRPENHALYHGIYERYAAISRRHRALQTELAEITGTEGKK